MKIKSNKNEMKIDEMKLLILSILLAVFFGIINAESALTEVLNSKNSTDSIKLFGLMINVIPKVSLLVIPFTIGFILSLSWKYQEKTKYNTFFAEVFYQINMYIYTFIFLFTIAITGLIWLLGKSFLNPIIASIILILIVIVFGLFIVVKTDLIEKIKKALI